MTDSRPTEVCITIDTEFSIAGHFKHPATHLPVAEPMVYGEVNGREEGLGFLLDTFDRYGTAATFFIECANYYYFGDAPMANVVRRIQSAGRDIQLHVHPVWLSFIDDAKLGSFARNDYCTGRSYDDLRRAFELCIEVFKRWVGNPPKALRTGSLRADANVFHVMRDLNIPLSSNVAMGVFQPIEPQLHFDSGRHLIDGVMELPVFTYQDMRLGGNPHRKSLQITSCSWPEMRHLLWKARRSGVENIVILTHPSEFMKKRDYRYTELTRNRINQQRLEKLCAFIRDHNEDFCAVDFSGQCDAWLTSELQQPFLTIPAPYAVGRKLHNRLNDLLWNY